MYSCTNTDGTIIPIKFKFRDSDNTIRSYNVIRVVKEDRMLEVGRPFDVIIDDEGVEKMVHLYYRFQAHKWFMQKERG